MTTKAGVQRAIEELEGAVSEALSARRGIFILSLIVPISTAVAAAISALFANMSALLTSLGLGGVNSATLITTVGDQIGTYLKERSALKIRIKRIKAILQTCDDNPDCLESVKNAIVDFFDELEGKPGA